MDAVGEEVDGRGGSVDDREEEKVRVGVVDERGEAHIGTGESVDDWGVAMSSIKGSVAQVET